MKRLDLFDLPDGMDEDSIVTATVKTLRDLYHDGWYAGSQDDMDAPCVVYIAEAPWLGDLD